MKLSDSPEAQSEVERLLENWGYWAGQGEGRGVHPMFRHGVKRNAGKPVNEPDALLADRCIARMGFTTAQKMLFYVYFDMTYPQDIESRYGLNLEAQRRILKGAQQEFFDHWNRTKTGDRR